MQNVLKKYSHEHLPNIIAKLELPSEFKTLIEQETTDLGVLGKLIEANQFASAVKFLALGLPKREAVWWAYLIAQDVEGNTHDLKTQQTLKAISEWVKQPNEDNRRKTQPLAEALGLYTPSSWAAMAAFWSGDNIAPIDKPAVSPPLFMSAEAVSNAIIIAATQKPIPADAYKMYLKQGLHIAMGGNGRIS